MRNYAIILGENDRDVITSIAEKIRSFDPSCKIQLFAKGLERELPEYVELVEVPEDVSEKGSSRHNFVVKWYVERKASGFLHVFEDLLGLDPERMSAFVPKIENFISIFGYDVWLNTHMDVCNFVFEKWISRIDVTNDNEALRTKYDKNIRWMSNANTAYMIYNLDNMKIEDVLFDETFSIAMFYIIKFFAQRRNMGRPGSFMNFYPTIDDEKGITYDMKYPNRPRPNENQTMMEEDKVFKEMGIDFRATEQIELVLEFMRQKLEAYNG